MKNKKMFWMLGFLLLSLSSQAYTTVPLNRVDVGDGLFKGCESKLKLLNKLNSSSGSFSESYCVVDCAEGALTKVPELNQNSSLDQLSVALSALSRRTGMLKNKCRTKVQVVVRPQSKSLVRDDELRYMVFNSLIFTSDSKKEDPYRSCEESKAFLQKALSTAYSGYDSGLTCDETKYRELPGSNYAYQWETELDGPVLWTIDLETK